VSDDVNTSRARWVGRAWIYSEDWQGDECASAGFFMAGPETYAIDVGPWVIELNEPSEAERDALKLCAGAPDDIRALFARLDAAEAEAAALRQAIIAYRNASMQLSQPGGKQWRTKVAEQETAKAGLYAAVEQPGAGAALLAELEALRAQLIGQEHLLQDLESFLHGARYSVETLKRRIGATLGAGAESEWVQLQLARAEGLATAATIALHELAESGTVQEHTRSLLQAAVDAFEAGSKEAS
jgi:hypothetical protein